MEISANPELLKQLQQAVAKRGPMTADELRAQRISYVYGMLGQKNSMTKEQVAEFIGRQMGWQTR